MRVIYKFNDFQWRVANIFCPNNTGVRVNSEPKASRPISLEYFLFREAGIGLNCVNTPPVDCRILIDNSNPVNSVPRCQRISVSLCSREVVCVESAVQSGRLFWVKQPSVPLNPVLSVPKRMLLSTFRNYATEIARKYNITWHQAISCRVEKHGAAALLSVFSSRALPYPRHHLISVFLRSFK